MRNFIRYSLNTYSYIKLLVLVAFIGCDAKTNIDYVESSNAWSNQPKSFITIDENKTIVDMTSNVLDGTEPVEAFYQGMQVTDGFSIDRYNSRFRIEFDRLRDSVLQFPYKLNDSEIVIKYRLTNGSKKILFMKITDIPIAPVGAN